MCIVGDSLDERRPNEFLPFLLDGFDVLAKRRRCEYDFGAHVKSLEVFGGLPCESESADGPLPMRSACGVSTLTPGLGPVNASQP